MRGPLRAALFGSAVMVAIAWPGIRHYGRMRAPDNVSVQPLNYATSTATAVAVVWVIAAVWLAVAIVRARGKRGDARSADSQTRFVVPFVEPRRLPAESDPEPRQYRREVPSTAPAASNAGGPRSRSVA